MAVRSPLSASLLLACVLAGATPTAQAQGLEFVYWVGLTNDWGQPFNWTLNQLPENEHNAWIDVARPGAWQPVVWDTRTTGYVIVVGNSLAIAQGGSLTADSVSIAADASFSVSGSFSARAFSNGGSTAFVGADVHIGPGVPFGPAPALVNTGLLTVSGVLDVQPGALFSNSGTLSLGGTLNLPADAVLSTASGNFELAGGSVHGGSVTIDSGNAEWRPFGTLDAGRLTLGGHLLVDGDRTLAIRTNEGAVNQGVLGALASFYGSGGIVSIGAAEGGQALVNIGQIYSARVEGWPAATDGTIALVGNAAGGVVLDNPGLVQVEGVLAVRSASGGRVPMNNEGSLWFTKGSRLSIDPGASFVLLGSGRLLVDQVDLVPAAGASLVIGGQSIAGSGTIAFTPEGNLGTITPSARPFDQPPGSGGQLTLIPDAALTVQSLQVQAGSTLVLDLGLAGSAGALGDSVVAGLLRIAGIDTTRFSHDGNLFLQEGGTIVLAGPAHEIGGGGSLWLQGTIRGDTGTESLVLASSTWTSGAAGRIAQLATFENQAQLGASGRLGIEAGRVTNSGLLVASQGGSILLSTPRVDNRGQIQLVDSGSAIVVSGQLVSGGDTGPLVFVDSGTRLTAAGYRQERGDTVVRGTLEAPLIDIEGGVLRGSGLLAGTLMLGPGGTVSPGDSPGHLRVQGSFTMTGGELLVELAGGGQGSGYDWLDVSGAATLNGGTLHLVFLNGFSPSPGSSFEFLSAGGGIGGPGFALVEVDGLPSGLGWDLQGGQFQVAAVPELAGWLSWFAGLALLGGLRLQRRRR